MACPALPLCGLAIGEAERGLPDVARRVRALLDKLGLEGENIVMRMTGCANGCVAVSPFSPLSPPPHPPPGRPSLMHRARSMLPAVANLSCLCRRAATLLAPGRPPAVRSSA